MKSEKAWDELQEKSNVLGIQVLFWLFRLLGRRVFSVILAPIMAYYFLVSGTARRASFQFLKKVQEREGIPPGDSIVKWSFRHFMTFGECLVDQLAVWSGSKDVRTAKFEGQDAFVAHVRRGNGALVIVAHLGNLEASRAVADYDDLICFNVMMHTKHAAKFNQILHDRDAKRSLNLIQVTELSPVTTLMLEEKLKNHEAVVIAGDRTPVGGGNRKTQVTFLGETASFPQGPYIIASLLKCPVYLLFCVREGDGFKIFIEPFADSIRLNRKRRATEITEWAQRYANRLEHYALRYPLQWSNFYDFWRKESPDN